jgi:ribosomal protein L7/L12
MAQLIIALIVILVLGALAGGNTFGESLRNGFGCIGNLITVGVIAYVVFTGVRCIHCNGSGKCASCKGSGKSFLFVDCSSCNGNGECTECKATGKGWALQLNIPKSTTRIVIIVICVLAFLWSMIPTANDISAAQSSNENVEHESTGSPADQSTNAPPLSERVIALVREGNKLEAIKLYKSEIGCDLLDAKNSVEWFIARHQK